MDLLTISLYYVISDVIEIRVKFLELFDQIVLLRLFDHKDVP